ncbi:MAG: hypothetical protein ACYCQJ_07970 [Nitrososphaerales archaeon]
MSPVDSAFEAVAVVFLVAALLYSYKLSILTRNAEIVALNRPKTFFAFIFISFACLLLSQVLIFINETFETVPFAGIISRFLIIATSLSAVVGIYNALYYYRTPSSKTSDKLGKPIEN